MYELRIEGGGYDKWGDVSKPAKQTVKKNDYDFSAAIKKLYKGEDTKSVDGEKTYTIEDYLSQTKTNNINSSYAGQGSGNFKTSLLRSDEINTKVINDIMKSGDIEKYNKTIDQ